jgi:hypothetical protein
MFSGKVYECAPVASKPFDAGTVELFGCRSADLPEVAPLRQNDSVRIAQIFAASGAACLYEVVKNTHSHPA